MIPIPTGIPRTRHAAEQAPMHDFFVSCRSSTNGEGGQSTQTGTFFILRTSSRTSATDRDIFNFPKDDAGDYY